MTLFASLRERLARPAVPPKCFACKQDEQPLERLSAQRWFCPSCAKDFLATPEDGDTWYIDLTPLRYRRRR